LAPTPQGKTLQNTYEGAFVYARSPELPASSMPAIYKIARSAGFDPTRACCVDNSCFGPGGQQQEGAGDGLSAPLFTPVASAETGDASPTSSQLPPPLGDLQTSLRDLREMLEDPRPAAQAIFNHQKPMSEVHEFDARGFRVPTAAQQP
jgi:hypothetical protein